LARSLNKDKTTTEKTISFLSPSLHLSLCLSLPLSLSLPFSLYVSLSPPLSLYPSPKAAQTGWEPEPIMFAMAMVVAMLMMTMLITMMMITIYADGGGLYARLWKLRRYAW